MSELHFIIELNAEQYAQLMQIVMRFGTGIGMDGISTSVEMRRALAECSYRIVPSDGVSS